MAERDEKTTVNMPVVPDWAIKLSESVQAGFQKVDTRMDTLDDKVDSVGHGLVTVTDQVTNIDSRLKVVEGREAPVVEIPRYSARVTALEGADDTLKKDIAELRAQTAAQNVTLDKILGNPTVRKTLQSVAALLIALSTLGTWVVYQKLGTFQAKSDDRPVAPAVTVVPVFMPFFDAGGSDAHP